MDKFMTTLKRHENIAAFVLLLANIILLNLLVQNLFFRIDMTDDRIYSLADASKKAVRNLDDQLVIKAFFSKDMPFPYNTNSQFLKDKLDEYKSYSKGKLTYEFVDPVDNEELEKEAQKYGIPAVQVNAVEKDKIEVKKVFMGVVLFYEDKNEVLPVIQSTEGLEYDITSAINKLTSEKRKKVAFLKGNGEQDLRKNMSIIYTALGDRYMVSPLELKNDRSVSTDVEALIVYHPTEPLSDWEKYAIDQYIMNGGKVAFLIDKIDTDLQTSVANKMELEIDDWLSTYGIKINNDLVYDANCSRINVSQRRGLMLIQNIVQYPFFPIINYFEHENVMVKDLKGVILPFASTIDTSLAREKGLKIEGLRDKSLPLDIVSDYKQVGRFDLVIVAVKSYDTPQAAKAAKSLCGKDGYVLSLQNGLGNLEILSEVLGQDRVLGGVTEQAAILKSPGVVIHTAEGITYIGSKQKKQPAVLRQVRELFNQCGIRTRLSKDINSVIWSKLVVNAGINALTALLKIKNGDILKFDSARKL